MRKIIMVLQFFCSSLLTGQTTYYVDQVLGKDTNTGTEKNNPIKSIIRANQLQLNPGDSLLFKRNCSWYGLLRPQGSGKKGLRIVLGAYGKGNAPIIDGQGKTLEPRIISTTLLLNNQEYWEIRDIEVQNFEKGNPENPVKKAGIMVYAKDVGTLHDFKLENLIISHVNGSLKTRENGGLFFKVSGHKNPKKRIPTNFDGIYINQCYFLHVDRGGFLNQSVWKTRDLNSKFGELCNDGKINKWYPSKNLLIENCTFKDIGGNGLVTRVFDAPIVQNNLFIKCSTKTTGNATYPYNCDNALWQYNEACYTVYNPGDIDASGFDSDYMCKNTVIQYNYSHHNDWGGLLVCSSGKLQRAFNEGTKVHNNVFQEDKHHMIRFSGNITKTEIITNLFISTATQTNETLWYKQWGGVWPDKTTVKDNIFYNSGAQQFLKLGKTTANFITDNILVGKSFLDYSAFKSFANEKSLHQKINKIQAIGSRENPKVSKAKDVMEIIWGK